MFSPDHNSPAPAGPSRGASIPPIRSSSNGSVVLYDWWLAKAEVGRGGKKRLAVGGFSNEVLHRPKMFISSPISHRIDACTLETTDGITVIIQGTINKVYTQKNGFSSEACRDFLIGFPCTWSSYADQYFEDEASFINNGRDACDNGENLKQDYTSPAMSELSQMAPTAPMCSTFSRIVVLNDWWLLMVGIDGGGKQLAVEGSTGKSRLLASRVFTSAPIVRRLDAYTLETADRIIVMIQGVINQDRTQQNGFPSEACRDFLIGFPYTWSSFAIKYHGNETPHVNNSGGSSPASRTSAKKSVSTSPFPTDKSPITRVVKVGTSDPEERSAGVVETAPTAGIQDDSDGYRKKLRNAHKSTKKQ